MSHTALAPPSSSPKVVVAPGAPVIGQSIRDSGFRGRFGAAVVAVRRNWVKRGGRIGDLVLQKGDVLVLSAGEAFDSNTDDFRANFKRCGLAPPRGRGCAALTSAHARARARARTHARTHTHTLCLSRSPLLAGILHLFT
jgi:hypothetical protein